MDGRVVSQAVVAVGYAEEGRREVPDRRLGDSENEPAWAGVFVGLIARGLKGGRLPVSDAHAAIVAAARQDHRRRLASAEELGNLMIRRKKRTRVVVRSRSSCERLIGSQLLEVHEQWLTEPVAMFNMEFPTLAAG